MARYRRNKIQVLYEAFAGPPRDFSAAPFLFLNDEMDASVTGAILKDLSAKGFAGVVLSAKTGLLVPFASKEYWGKLAAIIELARRLSMFVWLCDDVNQPGGTCSALLLKERPDFCAQGLAFRTGRYPAAHEQVVGMYLVKGGSILSLTGTPPKKRCLIASTVSMDTQTFSPAGPPWLPGPARGCLDILNPNAVRFYIDTALQPLQKHLKKYLGNTVVGILMRSPHNQCPFPWTESLPTIFKERFGYDLIGCLPSLVRDAGDFLRVRADYYSLISSLTRDYYRSIRIWAEQHNLSCSASVGEEGFIEKIPHTHGSPYVPLSETSIPGTNYRLNGTNYLSDTPPSLFGNFTPKFASSLARIKKDSRALSTVWEGEGWGVTPLKLKQTIDVGAAFGITTFFPHGVFESIVGLRKRDFPPSYYAHLPYWQDFDILSHYISRICLMMSAGNRQADILVLFPTTSLWVDTIGLGRLRNDGNKIITGLTEMIRVLLSGQRDFDFLYEEVASSRLYRFKGQTVAVGANHYSTVIIPWAAYIPESVFSFIEAAQKNGVNVVFVGKYPMVLGKPESTATGIGLTLVKDVNDLPHYLDLKARTRPTVTGDNSEKFVHQRRTYAGTDIHFFSYLGDEPFTGTLTLSGTGNPEAWDPETGRRYVISDFEATQDAVRFPVTLEPGKSWIYVIHSEHTDTLYGVTPPPDRKVGEFFFSGRWTVDYRSDNVFRIANFRLIRSSPSVSFPSIRGLFSDDRFGLAAKVMIAAMRAFTESAGRIWGIRKKIGYRSYTTMGREMRLYFLAARLLGLSLSGRSRYQQIDLMKDAALYMGLFLSTPLPPEGAEFEIEANFIVGYIPRRISLVWEHTSEPIEIYVNGELVSDRGKECFLWDRKNRMADLSDVIRWGTNRIGIRSRQPAFPSMIPALHWVEPVVLTGDFDVNMDIITARKETTRHLMWGKKRTGNYSGTVAYRCAFRLPKRFDDKRAILDLGDVRVACRVVLNGRDLGARLWPPYRYEVTDLLISGENEIEISVTNTTENLLGMPILSGVVSDPKISFFDS